MSEYYLTNSSGEYLRSVICDDIAEQLQPGETAHPGSAPTGMTIAQPAQTAAEQNASRISEIKVLTQQKIYSFLPQWKQANLTARGLQLTKKLATGGTLTIAESTEVAEIEAMWTRVENIRAASNTAEANGDSVAQFETTLQNL